MLKNMVALFTGATTDIGRATAKLFVEKGARVVLCDSHTSNGAALAKAIGNQAIYVPADYTSTPDVEAVIDRAEKEFGQLDFIINCHSDFTPLPDSKSTHDFITKQRSMSTAEFSKVVTNVEGLYNVIRLGVGLMGKNTDVDRWNGRGTIINTVPALSSNGSIASHALNACVLGMEQPLAADLGVEAIRVVSVVHDAKNSTDSASQDFARLAYLIATTPQINAATIPLCESVQ